MLNLKNFKEIGPLMSLGWILPCSIGIGVFIGYYIDKFFHCSPIGLLTFFILGTITGFINLFRIYSHAIKKDKK